MGNLNELLNHLEKTLYDKRASLIKFLQKGLADSTIVDTLSQLGIKNDQLRILYSWRNGVSFNDDWTAGQIDFFSFGTMLALEDAVIHHQSLVRRANVNESFLPIFTTGAGDYVLFNTDNKSINFESLFLYSPSILMSPNCSKIYDTLESFIETVIECYNSSAYKIKKGILEIDYDLEEQIASTKNPASPCWHKL